MDLDLYVFIAVVAVATAFFAFIWNVIRGHARDRRWLAARWAAALVVALVVVGWGTYWLMDSRTVQLMGDHVSRVDTTKKVVALTFDDGPDPTYVHQIITDLQQYGARGTFYVIGADVAADPSGVRTLAAAGEEIGNHSYNHRRLVFVSTTTADREVTTAAAAIRAAGYAGPLTFRAPYGKKLLSLPYALMEHDLVNVLWDLQPDSQDDIAGNAAAMTQYVMDSVRPGSIIELHPWAAQNGATRDALPMMLRALQAEGYQFVTVSQLLAQR